MPDIVCEGFCSKNFVAEGLVVAAIAAGVVVAAIGPVPSLGGNVQIFVYSVEKPKEELLRVVLVVALELARVLLHEGLEPDRNFRIVLK